MLTNLWNTFLYNPLLNALALLVAFIPNGDVGIAVIILTLLVKIVLFPLSQRSLKSQKQMNFLAPELKKIKESGVSKEEQAKLTFELYKTHKTNPFSGCLLLLIQIPIIIALYSVFYKGINFNSDVLYSFVHIPEQMNMMFLGLLDISQKSLLLAILAGISQFFQAYYMPKPAPSTGKSDFADSFSKSMQVQMKYVFPFIIGFIAYTVSGAVALYLIVSNIFAIGQQIYINKNGK